MRVGEGGDGGVLRGTGSTGLTLLNFLNRGHGNNVGVGEQVVEKGKYQVGAR